MNSPRSGFRRAAVASWALAGIGVAGVTGASALAYGDTLKPPPTQMPANVVEQAPAIPDPVPQGPPAPDVTDAPPPPPPVTTEAPAPETTVYQAPVQTYTPEQTYVPQTPVEQAPVTHQTQAPAATTPRSTSTRRALAPTTVNSPNFSPQISRSRGS